MPSASYKNIMRPSLLFRDVSSPPRKEPRNSRSTTMGDIRTRSIHPEPRVMVGPHHHHQPRTPLVSEKPATEVLLLPASPASPTSTTDLCLILDESVAVNLENSFQTVSRQRLLTTNFSLDHTFLEDENENDDESSVPSFFDDEISQWSCSDDEKEEDDDDLSWGEEEEDDEDELLGLSFVEDEKTETE